VPKELQNPPADAANANDTLLPPNDCAETEEVEVWLKIEDIATTGGGAGRGLKQAKRETAETNRDGVGELKESACGVAIAPSMGELQSESDFFNNTAALL